MGRSLKRAVKKGGFFLLSLLVFIPGKSFSQDRPLNPFIETFPPSTYADHNQVFCVERDPWGGMWFGSLGVVIHYTGEDWEKILTEPGMPVFDIDIDDKGRVWVGGQNEFGYLHIHSGKGEIASDKITPLRNSPDTGDVREKGIAGDMEYISFTNSVPDTLKDFRIIWDVHATEERVFFNASNVLFVLENDSLTPFFPEEKFFPLEEVGQELWMPEHRIGIHRLPFNEGKGSDSRKNSSLGLEKLPGSETLGEYSVMKVLDSVPGITKREEEALVLTKRNGLFRYVYGDGADGMKRIFPKGEAWGSRFRKAGIYNGLALAPRKNPWRACLALSTTSEGVILLDSTAAPVLTMDRKSGMGADYVWRTEKGPEGSGILWSGTNKGISKWIANDPRTYGFKGSSFSGTVTDIVRFKGRLLIGTEHGVFQRTREGEEEKWRPIPGSGEQRTRFAIVGEEGGDEASLLVASGNNGLYELRWNKAGAKWEKTWIGQDHAYTLTQWSGSGPYRWTAVGGRDGVILYSKKGTGDRQEELRITDLPGLLHSLQVSSAAKGRKVLWCGLRTKGAFRLEVDSFALRKALEADTVLSFGYEDLLDRNKKKPRITPFIGDDRNGLPKGRVQFFPFKDRVVAATKSGLYRVPDPAGPELEKASESFVPDSGFGPLFGASSKNNSKEVFRFQEGNDGTVWIQSKKHLHHLIPDGENGYRIDSLPFRGMDLGIARAILPDSNGITWLGGDNGVVRYDRKVEKDFEREYPCLLREVSASIKDTGKKKKDSVLFAGFYRQPAPEDPLVQWERVPEQPDAFTPSIPYSMNGLTFRFAAPYYEKQKEVRYSYRLKGFDEEWSEWKKETKKEYTNLKEGSYAFKVKAKNIYGVESELAEYRFRILPPWYRTWTAYGAYSVAGVAFIWLLLWLNSRRLLAQKERLERTVAERTKEIQEKNEALEEEKKEVEKQKDRVEEAHAEITQSIDYAQKIQNALLQSEAQASSELPDHFILFKPHSQVSGDFYWFKQHKGHWYIAAIDCTGHGVPGAFMSMLGINQLNEIMDTEEELTPGQILSDLRERVIRELSSSEAEETAKDGMDAAMVKIPLENSNSNSNSKEGVEIQIAGAQNPLYVIRKGIADVGATHVSPDHKMKPFKKSSDGIEIKGDPMPVGYDEYAEGDFSTVELQLQKGDMLYMFSDGYADQFGGPKGKKFRYGPFKQLLVELHEKPLEGQKAELDQVFENWKEEGQQEQVDDVVVIGVRV